jgi:hypothetical protein
MCFLPLATLLLRPCTGAFMRLPPKTITTTTTVAYTPTQTTTMAL